MTVNLDHRHLQGITAEIGYRLGRELARDTAAVPQYLEDLVRALDDLPAARSPSIVPSLRHDQR